MRRYKRKTADQQDKSLKRGLQIRKNNLSRMRQKRIHKAGICASFFICKLFENSSKKDVFQVLPSPNFCQQLEKIPLLKIGKGMVRVRSIFSTILCVLKNGNKKARSLDKIPKLRAFLPFQLLLIIGLFGCGSQIWTDDLRVMSPTSYRAAPSRDIYCLLMATSIVYHSFRRMSIIFLKNNVFLSCENFFIR